MNIINTNFINKLCCYYLLFLSQLLYMSTLIIILSTLGLCRESPSETFTAFALCKAHLNGFEHSGESTNNPYNV